VNQGLTGALLSVALLLGAPEPGSAQEASRSRGRVPDYDARTRQTEYAGPGRETPDPADLQEIRIGYFGPAEPAHPLGGDLWLAVNLAVEEANEAGGYHGLPFTLVVAWSEDPWGTGVSDLARMAYDDGIWAILGSVDGESTHLAETVVAKARLPLLSFASTDKTVNLANVPWMFASLPQDDRLAPVVARAVVESGRGEGFTIVSTTDHDSHATLIEIRKALNRRGASPLHHLEIAPGEEDLAALIRRLSTDDPGALLIIADPLDSARLVTAVRAAGLDLPIAGGPSFGRRPFLERTGKAAEGVLLPFLCEPESASGTFAATFRRRFDRPADCATAQAYDTARLLMAALREAGLNRPKIRDQIGSLPHWRGAAGSIRWNGLGQNQREVVLATVRNGTIVAVETPGTASEPARASERVPYTSGGGRPVIGGPATGERGTLMSMIRFKRYLKVAIWVIALKK
jgi:branched-chain amino acid transport system substrate-binding protein